MERRNFVSTSVGLVVSTLVTPTMALANVPDVDLSFRERIWTTKDGREVAIKDMSDDHVRNTIYFLNRTMMDQLAHVTAATNAREARRNFFERLQRTSHSYDVERQVMDAYEDAAHIATSRMERTRAWMQDMKAEANYRKLSW